MAYRFSLATWIAAYTALFDQIKEGTGEDEGAVLVNADGETLATIPIDLDTSAVNEETGNLTIVTVGTPNATDTGTAAKLVILNRDGDPVTDMDCKVGTVAEPGYCVLNSLSVVSGMPVDIQSLTIPAGTILA